MLQSIVVVLVFAAILGQTQRVGSAAVEPDF